METVMGIVGFLLHLGVIGLIVIAVIMAMAHCLWIKCWKDEQD